MKIYNEITKNILILVGFVALIISIAFLPKEIIEKLVIVIPFIILYLGYLREKTKENKRTKKDEIEKQKDVQYFFNNFIEWIKGGRERSSYLENFVLTKFHKYERYFGISILKIDELSPDEREYYINIGKEGDFILIYVIYVLEGKYILDYSIEQQGYDVDVRIGFRIPKTYKDDYRKRIEEILKAKKNMINDIIEYVKKEHNIQLEYKKKKI